MKRVILTIAILLGLGSLLLLLTALKLSDITTARQPEAEIHYENKVIVLVYHDVQEPDAAGMPRLLTVTPQQFDAHLKALQDHSYQVISMEDYVRFARQGKPVPPNAVVLTFDDGYESFYTRAYPILQKHGVPASNFVIGAPTDKRDPKKGQYLTWNQMRELVKAGHGIYSHTYDSHRMVDTAPKGPQQPALTHPAYLAQSKRTESTEEFRKRILSDLTFMNERLRTELGDRSKLLAFPYGAYNKETLQAAEEAGIELLFTIREGINTASDRLVHRIDAGEPYITADTLIATIRNYH
ncbi:polysaccharide deacetylase family protein [Paenibacillus elgii]|uniref:polysaccharide deacetylase family protein n=1 Tax=Paenibacillus elgii TaxID=189691 RepID=UPI00203ED035|nr:polysaccharide deacetylase family protein [Paenibacillus elgii]MCM3269946.1 polysaccharide deacetylase family protein [Paenibacillus elgii]